MGSLRAMAQRPMSPARARLLEAVQRSRYALKDLSTMLGRNHSYLQQYVVKGSPRVLPEDVRHRLAELLSVDEVELREGDAPRAGAGRTSAAVAAVAAVAASAQLPARWVPLMVEGDQAESSNAAWPLTDIIEGVGDSTVALALTEPHGVFQPRNILLCDRGAPRAGDLAVLLQASRVLAIGLLVPSPRGTVSLLASDAAEPQPTFPAGDGTLLRVLAVRAA